MPLRDSISPVELMTSFNMTDEISCSLAALIVLTRNIREVHLNFYQTFIVTFDDILLDMNSEQIDLSLADDLMVSNIALVEQIAVLLIPSLSRASHGWNWSDWFQGKLRWYLCRMLQNVGSNLSQKPSFRPMSMSNRNKHKSTHELELRLMVICGDVAHKPPLCFLYSVLGRFVWSVYSYSLGLIPW